MPSLLYCVTQSSPAVSIAAGVSEAEVSSRELLGVRVYWSDIGDPAAMIGEPASLKQAALQFRQVLREILAVTTPIPFHFPTLLESAEVFEQHLAPEQESYREALERIGN